MKRYTPSSSLAVTSYMNSIQYNQVSLTEQQILMIQYKRNSVLKPTLPLLHLIPLHSAYFNFQIIQLRFYNFFSLFQSVLNLQLQRRNLGVHLMLSGIQILRCLLCPCFHINVRGSYEPIQFVPIPGIRRSLLVSLRRLPPRSMRSC